MNKNKPMHYKSDAFAAIHDTATGLLEAGIIDKQKMQEFDTSCLTPFEELTADIEQAEKVVLSEKDTSVWLELLDNTPKPSANLIAAAKALPTDR